MPENQQLDLLRAEQRAFDSKLGDMLTDHAGQFVVFKGGQAVDFFPSYGAAYTAAIKGFGVGTVFLVSEVKKRGIEPVSLSWMAGAMFG